MRSAFKNDFYSSFQGRQWTGRDGSHGTVGDVSGSGHAATCQRRCHIGGRFSVAIEHVEFPEQSSRYEPTDKHVKHIKYGEPTCRPGDYEIRTEEDDQRFKDEGESFYSCLLCGIRQLLGKFFLLL